MRRELSKSQLHFIKTVSIYINLTQTVTNTGNVPSFHPRVRRGYACAAGRSALGASSAFGVRRSALGGRQSGAAAASRSVPRQPATPQPDAPLPEPAPAITLLDLHVATQFDSQSPDEYLTTPPMPELCYPGHDTTFVDVLVTIKVY